MFGHKKPDIAPGASDSDVLIQMTQPVEIKKKTRITVPTQYKAIAFIDQKPMFRIEPCISKSLVEAYGKEYLGKQFRIAFISAKTFAQSAWGFGNIQVNNDRLKEAYCIGANGKFSIEVVDYAKTIMAFPDSDVITMEQLREKFISTLKSVGTPILGEYFAKTSTSVFEITSLLADFRDKFKDALEQETIFGEMGLKISSLTVDGFHVDEDDLDQIRTRLNA